MDAEDQSPSSSPEAPVVVIVKQEWDDSGDSDADARGNEDGASGVSAETGDSRDDDELGARTARPRVAAATAMDHDDDDGDGGTAADEPPASQSHDPSPGLRERNAAPRGLEPREPRDLPPGGDGRPARARRPSGPAEPPTRSSPRARPWRATKSEESEFESPDDKFICGICWLGFGDPDTLKEHQDLHAAEGSAPPDAEALRHGGGRRAAGEGGVASARSPGTGRRRRRAKKAAASRHPWRCRECDRGFPTAAALSAHARTHGGGGGPDATVANSRALAREPLPGASGRPPVPGSRDGGYGGAFEGDGGAAATGRRAERGCGVEFGGGGNGERQGAGSEARVAFNESPDALKRKHEEAHDAAALAEWEDERPAVSASAHAMLSPPPAHCTADVWEHFGFPLSEAGVVDRTVTICRVCGVRIKYYNTTNMRKHLQRRHSDVFGAGASYDSAGEAGAGSGIPVIFKRIKFSAKREREFADEPGESSRKDRTEYRLITNSCPAGAKRLGAGRDARAHAPRARDGEYAVAYDGADVTAERRPQQNSEVAYRSSSNGAQGGRGSEVPLAPKRPLATVKLEHGEVEDPVPAEWDDEKPAVSASAHAMLSPPPAHCTADVWEHFGFPLSEAGVVDRTVTICRVCGVRIKYYNTTNMRKHLQRRHSDVFGAGASYDSAGETGAGSGIPVIFKRIKFSAKREREFADEPGESSRQDRTEYRLITNSCPVGAKRLGAGRDARAHAPRARDGEYALAYDGADVMAERRPQQNSEVAYRSSSNGAQGGRGSEVPLAPKRPLAAVKLEHGEAEDAVPAEWEDEEPAVSAGAHAMLSPPPAHCTADVWEHFGFPMSEAGVVDRAMTMCRVCRVRIKYNTTNMRKHLQRWHPEVFGGAGEAGATPAACAPPEPSVKREPGSSEYAGSAREKKPAANSRWPPAGRALGARDGERGERRAVDGAGEAAEARPRPGPEVEFGSGGNGERGAPYAFEETLGFAGRDRGEADDAALAEWEDDEPSVCAGAHAMLSPPPAHCTADVWEHFGFPLSEAGVVDRSVTVCRVCDVKIKYYNTTNMRKHLQRWHPDVFGAGEAAAAGAAAGAARPEPEPGVTAAFKRQRLAARREQELTEKVGRFVALEMRPCVVENAAFQELIQFLEPKYKLPSRPHFSERVIPELYTRAAAAVGEELERAASVALTSEVWTSRSAARYVTVSAHFVSPAWELRRYVLQTRPLCGPPEPAAAGRAAAAAAADWNLLRRRRGGRVPLVAGSPAEAQAASREPSLGPCLACFALAVAAASRGGPLGPAAAPPSDGSPSPSDAEERARLAALDVARELRGSRCPAASMVLPCRRRILDAAAPARGDGEAAREAKRAARAAVERGRAAGADAESFLAESAAMDPRYGARLDGETRALCRRAIVRKAVELRRAPGPGGRAEAGGDGRGEPGPDDGSPGPLRGESGDGEAADDGERDAGLREDALAEMELYEREAPIAADDDPLEWWAGREPRFPLLALAARHYLGVPAASVPGERVFAEAGDAVSARRAQISPDEVDRLVFLGSNLRYIDR